MAEAAVPGMQIWIVAVACPVVINEILYRVADGL